MHLTKEIASDEVLNEAYAWLCERRKHYSANSDVWDVRWRWNQFKPWLQEQLLAGSYHFDALRRIRRDNDTIELWSALDALVLKAIAMVLTRRLSFSERCYHLLGHGGAKAAVRDVVEHLPGNPFVFRTVGCGLVSRPGHGADRRSPFSEQTSYGASTWRPAVAGSGRVRRPCHNRERASTMTSC